MRDRLSLALSLFPHIAGTCGLWHEWAYALARTGGGRMGAMAYLVPPVAILLGWRLFFGAMPPLLALAGSVLCLAGVAVTRGVRLTRRRGTRFRVVV
jgi:drug/metabolite transporter (DMT)-like permease